MNKIFSYIKIASENLRKKRIRCLFTVIAIAMAISILIIMMAAGGGLKSMILSEIDFYGSDTINIEVRIPGKGNITSAMEMGYGAVVTTFKDDDIDELRSHPNVEYFYTYITGQEVIKYEGGSRNVVIFGYGAEAPHIEKMDFNEGRFYTESEENSLSSVIVLGSELKDALFGDDNAISKNVYVKGFPFKVVGVMSERGGSSFFNLDSMAYIPTKTMQKKILGTDYVLGASAKVKDAEKIEETVDDFIYIMREQHDIDDPDRDDFQVSTMDEAMDMVENILDSINFLLIVLALISLIVGGVGITNIMYVSVAERTFEIGLRRALGAKRKDILFQFLAEAVLLTLLGGALGIISGIIIVYVFNYFSLQLGFGITAVVSTASIVWSLIFSAALGLSFGVYPAKEASNLDPIVALTRK